MKLFTLLTLFAIATTSLTNVQADESVAQVQKTEELNWVQDFEQAKQLAKEQSKPIFLYFTGSDWCPWCMRMDKEILSKTEFKDALGSKMIFVKADFPKKSALAANIKKQNEELQSKFAVRGFPTVVILDQDGNKIGTTGYQQGGPILFAAKVESILESAKKPAQQ